MQVYFEKCYKAIDYCNQNKSFGLFYSQNHDADTNMHLHECCEVLLCVSGGTSFFINDRIYEVNNGDIFIINQFESHKIISNEKNMFERFVFQIHPSFLIENSTEDTDLSRCFYRRNEKVSHKISLKKENQEKITNLFLDLKEERTYGDDISKSTTVIQFLIELNKLFYENNKDYEYIPCNDNSAIIRSIKYISENFKQELSLEKIAKNSYISVNQLCRLYKKYLGTTVLKFVITKRITEAKIMLRKGATVSDASLECGFNDYTNFIRTFKTIVGISPGKYAKKPEQL